MKLSIIHKLTTKKIYGIFGIATILFLIISFLVAQNIQNYGKNSTAPSNLANNSSQNSSNNSANPNSKSSLSQNSQNSQSENLSNSQNSSNKTGEINQNSSQIQNNDLTIPGATEKRYFKGSINKKPIKMVLNYSCTSTPICHEQTIKGNYIYENISKDKLQLNCTFLGAGIAKFECQESEISDSNNLGQTSKTTGIWSGETSPSDMDKISGTWTNSENTVKLPFSLEGIGEFNLEDFLVKSDSKLQPLITNAEYDVAVLKKCDLVVRFKKSEISISIEENTYNFNNLLPNNREGVGSIECSDKPFEIRKFGPLNDNFEAQKLFLQNLGIPQAQNLSQNLYVQGNSEYTFEFNKRYFRFFQVLRAPSDYKFQFNSLAPSKPSVRFF